MTFDLFLRWATQGSVGPLVLSTSRFVMVPLNLTCLHCLEHSFFEQIFNLYSNPFYFKTHEITYVAFMQVYFQWSNCHVCHYSTFSTSRPKWTRSWYPWSNTTLVIHDRSSAYTWTTSAFRLWRYCKNAWSCEMHSVMCPCYVII